MYTLHPAAALPPPSHPGLQPSSRRFFTTPLSTVPFCPSLPLTPALPAPTHHSSAPHPHPLLSMSLPTTAPYPPQPSSSSLLSYHTLTSAPAAALPPNTTTEPPIFHRRSASPQAHPPPLSSSSPPSTTTSSPWSTTRAPRHIRPTDSPNLSFYYHPRYPPSSFPPPPLPTTTSTTTMDPNLNLHMNPLLFPTSSAGRYGFGSPTPDYSSLDIEDTSRCSVEDGSQSPPEMSAAIAMAGGSREVAILRKKKERRGHTKSRRGCFNCKRRRIKCQETHPACGHCVKTGLTCEYPRVLQVMHQPHNQIPLFSLLDMRFFQHFLENCAQSYPSANSLVWSHHVPYLSHTYEYLMHAILGLAASDLVISDPSLAPVALTHRYKSVQAIKRRLNDIKRVSSSTEETNALIATCYALAYQSVLLNDGMAEFMTFVRGILIVSMHMWIKGISPIFSNLQIEDPTCKPTLPTNSSQPTLPRHWLNMANTAITNLRPLCQQPLELAYHNLLSDLIATMYTSTAQAHKALRTHYRWWMTLPHSEFRTLIDPANQTMVLLATHWIAIKQMLATATATDARRHQQQQQQQQQTAMRQMHDGRVVGLAPDFGVFRWLKYMNRLVNYPHHIYNTWPAWVEEQLEHNPSFFGMPS